MNDRLRHDYLRIAPDVAEALAAHRPVVALESTIIAHGMPYPQNLETARAAEATVRRAGAVPATIAILDGRIRIGLSGDDLERLAAGRGQIAKLSRRDLPVALASGTDGATTVAATMICAALAGITVFATGGIGGVHRGGEASLDISADLDELARTEVAVVCSGAKAILDLPRTLEYLETRGVTVVGFATDRFPAFYTADSGLRLETRCDSAEKVARIIRIRQTLGIGGGVVIANPIPAAAALDPVAVTAAIDQALHDAATQGVTGKAVTPFLLSRLEHYTGGRSLEANIALVLDNARVGAAIAVALAALAPETTLPPRGAALGPGRVG
ncbi:MAG: pseudouridine-5'-phosphate glycosidase [Azospirillaceae bacterium]|nr:pseudouridine-5'-phosphate glycosidase [Azospirillaceae bacterium]